MEGNVLIIFNVFLELVTRGQRMRVLARPMGNTVVIMPSVGYNWLVGPRLNTPMLRSV